MQNSQKPLARKDGLVIQEMPEEVLVYDLNTNKAHCLNKTAAAVWKNCNGKNSVSDIALVLKSEFNVTVEDDFIWLAIDQLNKDNLLEGQQNVPAGVSRREVVRRIGLAAVIALPLVTSLAAPSAARAGSACTINTACTQNSDCAAGGNCVCTGGFCASPSFSDSKKA